MTAAAEVARDEIDELVDWQLQKSCGVYPQEMVTLAGIGWLPVREEFLLNAARWDPEKRSWGGVTFRNEWEECDEV